MIVKVSDPAGSVVHHGYNGIGERSAEIMDCLAFPGNFGYVTVEAKEGTPERKIPAMVLSGTIPKGKEVVANPIALLRMKDEGKDFPVIIAVPADSTKQTLRPQNFPDFAVRYAATKHMIESWFVNSKNTGRISVVAWSDERVANALPDN